MVEHSVLSQASLAERHVWGSQSRTYGICGAWGQLKPPQEDAVSPAAQAAPARTKRVGAGVECGGGGVGDVDGAQEVPESRRGEGRAAVQRPAIYVRMRQERKHETKKTKNGGS